jgi:pimeloyl-ACP methyl ester carboxylesterase
MESDSGLETQESWATIRGLRVHHFTAGRGFPVLLLHGGGANSATHSFKEIVEPLARHYRVISLDWPGYGKSDKPQLKYTTEFFIDFLDEFVNCLGLDKFVLVGHSMGGSVALGYALKFPAKVRCLVLVDSYGLGDRLQFQKLSYLLTHVPLLNRLLWQGRAVHKKILELSLRYLTATPATVSGAYVDEVWEMLKEGGECQAFRSWLVHEIGWRKLRTDYQDRLERINIPTLIIHSQEDKLIPLAWSQRAQQKIKGSKLVILDGCGHCPTRERPEELVKVILPFLQDAGPPRGAQRTKSK